ncbi:MAG: tRNA (adenosine(37)-N6)-threonylcarbamoyltransferase complex dimerization subunit type 1 TsaB [Ilumatobacteraceae bacterium]|nr:tRNA (adenosine(37)-N6)-threonylcarbamoyltransferase complex dimerization subunit type 1 TsaB [Ilumatobacteraceae bacterium]
MLILGIETAVEHVSVALADHRGTLATSLLASDRRHAESLVPMIQFVCAQAGINTKELDAIAVDTGPGLFTGMRVGIATAKSMAWALDIPVIPVCSLDILAQRVTRCDDIIAAALDARRGEVYWALYRPASDASPIVQRLTEPVVTVPDDLAALLNERAQMVVCVGSGIERYKDTIDFVSTAQCAGPAYAQPHAQELLIIAAQRAIREEWVSASDIEAMYLRAPDAEINWATRLTARDH